MTKSKIKTSKKKRTEQSLPRITLNSPLSDVVIVIDALIKWFARQTEGGFNRIDILTGGHNLIIYIYNIEQGLTELDRVCDWLEVNRLKLYTPVWKRKQKIEGLIEKKITISNYHTLNNKVADLVYILQDTLNTLGVSTPPTDKKELNLSAESKALAVLAKHPDWTNTKIAKEAGVSRQNLYRMNTFMAAREIQRKEGRKRMPKGSKDIQDDGTQKIEAWDNNK